MPTLSARNEYEICCLCSWEDDGQDSETADVVSGGPNGDYSLSEARENFAANCTMYRPSDSRAHENYQRTHQAKKMVHKAFASALKSRSESEWLLAMQLESEL